ncbi:MAG: NusG domain II-containing protein [Filifactoraceae bacterium]
MLNKYDIYLIIILLLISGIMTLGVVGDDKANKITISVDGKEFGSYNLEKDQKIDINLKGKHNVVEIKNKTVKMVEADCPDKYCVNHGEINKGYETIVCLPNKIIVEFSNKKTRIDTVVG